VSRRWCFLVCFLLLIVACGDDSVLSDVVTSTTQAATTTVLLAGEEQAFADGLAAAIAGDASEEVAAGAQCAAEVLVAEFGVEGLSALGITSDAESLDDLAVLGANMTESEREATADVLLACMEPAALFGIGGEEGGAEAACIADLIAAEVSDEVASRVVVTLLAGEEIDPVSDPDIAEPFMTAVLACMDVREMMESQLIADGATEEIAACIAYGLSDETVEDLIPFMFFGGEPDAAEVPEFFDVVETCTSE